MQVAKADTIGIGKQYEHQFKKVAPVIGEVLARQWSWDRRGETQTQRGAEDMCLVMQHCLESWRTVLGSNTVEAGNLSKR